ncbi:MAG TPA: cytochrome P450, partial [Ktedonobacteraceae bacterium]|nr:cytochrome P450 [Ktedonobacteraceae bacterium]
MVSTTTRAQSSKNASSRTKIPGPKNHIRSMLAFQRTPLQFLTHMTSTYGDVSQFRLLNLPIVIINHPDDVQRVLQKNHKNYDKNALLFNASKTVFGNGLVTNAGGEVWIRQRRLMQPAFHRRRIEGLGSMMTDSIVSVLSDWDNMRDKQVFNVESEMMRLTLKIVSLALFSLDISPESNPFGQACAEVNTCLTNFVRFPLIPLTWPTPQGRRYQRALQTIDEICYSLIRERRESKEDSGDLVTMLLQARDEETGEGMSELQLRDEVVTLLFAGHETTAVTLTWIWYLLSQHPDVEERFHNELDTVLNGRVPTMEDLAQLPYTKMVVDEAMRIYPSAWEVMRHTIQDDELGGYHIPAGTILFWSQYIVHRHPEFWDNPEEFIPERFLPELAA